MSEIHELPRLRSKHGNLSISAVEGYRDESK